MINVNFKVKKDQGEKNFGRFVIEPLDQGCGQTLGNSLRRVLLTSLEGAAVTSVRIDGVKHQFSTLTGLKEDIVEFTINLKKIRIHYTGEKPAKLVLVKSGPCQITAADVETPAGVEIINKDLVLGNLSDGSSHIKSEFWVESGYGYVPFEEREQEEIGIIPMDAIFTPVKRVNYKVSATRVGRITNFDKLTLEIETDGTISAKNAMLSAAKNLTAFFTQISTPKVSAAEGVSVKNREKEEEMLTVEELELPTRIVNALLKVGIRNVAELKEAGRQKLSKIKNLGGKSLKVIEAALIEKKIRLED